MNWNGLLMTWVIAPLFSPTSWRQTNTIYDAIILIIRNGLVWLVNDLSNSTVFTDAYFQKLFCADFLKICHGLVKIVITDKLEGNQNIPHVEKDSERKKPDMLTISLGINCFRKSIHTSLSGVYWFYQRGNGKYWNENK